MFLTGFLQKKDRDAFHNGEGVWGGGGGGGRGEVEIPAPQDFKFLSILNQVCDKVIKVSVFTCFLATAVTI